MTIFTKPFATHLLTLLFAMFASLLQAQHYQPLDSMLLELNRETRDTSRVKLLHNIANDIMNSDRDKAMEYINEGLALARKRNYKRGIAFMLSKKGTIYSQGGAYIEALGLHKQALDIYRQLPLYKDETAQVLNDIGVVYYNQSIYTEALQYFTESLKLGEEIKDDYVIGLAYLNIGSVFQAQYDYKKNLLYAQKSLHHYRRYGDDTYVAAGLRNIGEAYTLLDSLPQASVYLKQALQLYKKNNNKRGEAATLSEIASLYVVPVTRLQYLLEAQAIWDAYNPQHLNSIKNMTRLGATYIELFKNNPIPGLHQRKPALLDTAGQHLSRALEYSRLNNNLSPEPEILNSLSELKALQGNYKAAFEYKNQAYKQKDSLTSQDYKNELASIENRHEIEAKNKQLQINQLALSNARRTRVALLCGAGLLLIIGGLLFYQNRIRRKTNIALMALNNELDEANKVKTKFFGILSHDLRSPIVNLVNFLHLQREMPDALDGSKTRKFHEQLTNSAENLLDNMEAMLLWSKSQMERFAPRKKVVAVSDLFLYIQKQAQLYPDIRFCFSNAGDLKVYTDEDYLKSIMYNLTVNAAKALAVTPDPFIEWRAVQENHGVYLTITDNGPGANKEQMDALYSEKAVIGTRYGFGMHIIRDLAAVIQSHIEHRSCSPNGSVFIISFETSGVRTAKA